MRKQEFGQSVHVWWPACQPPASGSVSRGSVIFLCAWHVLLATTSKIAIDLYSCFQAWNFFFFTLYKLVDSIFTLFAHLFSLFLFFCPVFFLKNHFFCFFSFSSNQRSQIIFVFYLLSHTKISEMVWCGGTADSRMSMCMWQSDWAPAGAQWFT